MNELATIDDAPQRLPVTAVVRLKHGILHELAKRLGGQSAAAAVLGVTPSEYGLWVNLKKRPPRWDDKKAIAFAEQILSLTGHTVDEIWPEWLDSCLGMQTTTEITREFTPAELRRLESPSEVGDLHIESGEGTEAIERALRCLTFREREIVSMRHGLNGKSPMTYKEVGSVFKITTERARQIERRAIRKLQDHAQRQEQGNP